MGVPALTSGLGEEEGEESFVVLKAGGPVTASLYQDWAKA